MKKSDIEQKKKNETEIKAFLKKEDAIKEYQKIRKTKNATICIKNNKYIINIEK